MRSQCGLCYAALEPSNEKQVLIPDTIAYYCDSCKKVICNDCKHKQYLQTILEYSAKNKIKITLAHRLFNDWCKQNEKNVNLIVQLIDNPDIVEFASQNQSCGRLFKIWCNSTSINEKDTSMVLDKVVCWRTFEKSVDMLDIELLEVLDEQGFDFKTHIDKRFKRNECTPFLTLCRKPAHGKGIVQFMRKLFEISKKHNAPIDMFAKDECSRNALENAALFGTSNVVECLLNTVYKQSNQDIIDILTISDINVAIDYDRDEKDDHKLQGNTNTTNGDHDSNSSVVIGNDNKPHNSTQILLHCYGIHYTPTDSIRQMQRRQKKQFQTFKILLKYIKMYNLNWMDSYRTGGWNVLHYICANGWDSYLEVLYRTVGNNIDWNVKTKNKRQFTPLMIALSTINFNSGSLIGCIRSLANIQSIDVASNRYKQETMKLKAVYKNRNPNQNQNGDKAVKRDNIKPPPMNCLEYSCYFGQDVGVVKILFQALMRQLDLEPRQNMDNQNENVPLVVNEEMIDRLLQLSRQGEKECEMMKKWAKKYNKQNYEKIEVLLVQIKNKLKINSNNYRTISSLINYVPKDLTENESTKMLNEYANIDAQWDENYNKMLKSTFSSNNYEIPKIIGHELKKLQDSSCEKKDDWYILKQLGKGAFGQVALAIHSQLGKKAALKYVTIKNKQKTNAPKSASEQATNPKMKPPKKQTYVLAQQHFIKVLLMNTTLCWILPNHMYFSRLQNLEMEIGALRRLQHPNIIKLFAFKFQSQKNGDVRAMLVFEFAHNGDLKGFVEKCQYLPEKIVKSFARFVLYGLEHLHKKEMIHRDIKPANILLDFQFQPKLSDFGLSRDRNLKHANEANLGIMSSGTTVNVYNQQSRFGHRNSITSSNSTWITHFAGTPWYMAPEAHIGDVSAQGDIFSLGVTLWDILIGEYGNKKYNKARTPFKINRRVRDSIGGCKLEPHGDDLYQKIIDKKHDEYIKSIKNKLKNEKMPYRELSDSFYDLFVEMVASNKKDRPSIKQILNHKWMKDKKLLNKFQLRNEMKRIHDTCTDNLKSAQSEQYPSNSSQSETEYDTKMEEKVDKDSKSVAIVGDGAGNTGTQQIENALVTMITVQSNEYQTIVDTRMNAQNGYTAIRKLFCDKYGCCLVYQSNVNNIVHVQNNNNDVNISNYKMKWTSKEMDRFLGYIGDCMENGGYDSLVFVVDCPKNDGTMERSMSIVDTEGKISNYQLCNMFMKFDRKLKNIPKLFIFSGLKNKIPKKQLIYTSSDDSETQVQSNEDDLLCFENCARLYCNGNSKMSKTFVESFCEVLNGDQVLLKISVNTLKQQEKDRYDCQMIQLAIDEKMGKIVFV